MKGSPIFQTLGLFQKRLFRVAARDDTGRVVNMLNMLDIVNLLLKLMNQGKFVSTFSKTALELGLGTDAPITILDTEPTIKALRILNSRGLTVLGIVNEKGELVGSIDAGDLKGAIFCDEDILSANPFGSLLLPINEFIKHNGIPKEIDTVESHTPFSMILLRFQASQHELKAIWVLDQFYKPKSLITLTHLMRGIINLKQPDRKV